MYNSTVPLILNIVSICRWSDFILGYITQSASKLAFYKSKIMILTKWREMKYIML
jgi:hypothetical protein